MAATNQPFGFRPVWHPSGILRAQVIPVPWASGFATNLFSGQPVNWVAAVSGKLQAVTANNVAIGGIFAGWFGTITGSRPGFFPNWVASTSVDTTQPFYAYVHTDPDVIFEAQADGASNNNILGGQVLLSTGTVGTGSTVTGISTDRVVATSVATTVQGQFRVIGMAPYPDNAWGAGTGYNVDATLGAFTVLQLQIARPQWAAPVVSQ